MKLANTREYYAYYSSETSKIVRQLGFAGIGIIWLFRIADSGDHIIPVELINPTLLITFALTMDLLHYIVGTIVWGAYNRYKEKSDTAEEMEFLAPRQINWVGNTFFWLKVIIMVAAYYFLLKFLAYKMLIQ